MEEEGGGGVVKQKKKNKEKICLTLELSPYEMFSRFFFFLNL